MKINVLHIVYIFIAFQFNLLGQNKIDDKKLDKLFWDGKYNEIIQEYYVLHKQDINNPEICFKYGTSLLFEADSIQKLIKANNLLLFAASQEIATAEYHFFCGRAYHTRSVFDSALVQFDLYKRKRGKKTVELPVDQYITYCNNGKTIQKIASANLQRYSDIQQEDIGEAYDLRRIKMNGRFDPYKTDLTKIDIKKGLKPVWLYSDYNLKFFASFGEKDEGTKDLYMVEGSREEKRITRLPNSINTSEDEDFPYFDFESNYLYFSSKGHNSMGGYDIYRIDYDTATKSWGKIENLGVGISTPFDDYLFIYNGKANQALLTSSWLGKTNRLALFSGTVTIFDKNKVKKQEVVASFKNEGNPNIKLTDITVIDKNTQELIGKFNADETGNIKMNLPSGEYSYLLGIYGSRDGFKADISIPTTESQIIQEITYKLDEKNNEEVIISNKNPENATEIIANNIEKDTENKVPTSIPKDKPTETTTSVDPVLEKEALEKMDMVGFNQNEVIDKISDKLIEIELAQKENELLMSNLNVAISNNRAYFDELQQEIDSIEKKSDELSEIEKIEQLNYIKNVLAEQNEVMSQTIWMQKLNDSLQKVNSDKQKFTEIVELGTVIQELTNQNKYDEAYIKIIEKHEQIQSISTNSAFEKIYEDLHENELEQARIEKNILSLSSELVTLNESLKNTELDILNASKKEKVQLEEKRDEIQQKINSNQKRTKAYQRDLEELKNQAVEFELKRNLISTMAKEVVEESISYENSKKNYLTDAKASQSKLDSIQEQINQSIEKLSEIERKYLEIIKADKTKRNNLDENSSPEKLIELEKELAGSIQKLLSEQNENPEKYSSSAAITENYLQEKLQEIQTRINELTKNNTDIASSNTSELKKENEEKSDVNSSTNVANNQTINSQNKQQNQNSISSNSNKENEEKSDVNSANNVANNQTSNSQNKQQNQNSISSNSNKENEEKSDVNSANNVANNQTSNSQNKQQNQNSTTSNTNKENEEKSDVNSANNVANNQTSNSQNKQQNQNSTTSNTNKENEEKSDVNSANNVANNQTTNSKNKQQNQNSTTSNSNKENEEKSDVNSANNIANNQTSNSQNKQQNQNSISSNSNKENEEKSDVNSANNVANNQTTNSQNKEQNQNSTNSNSNKENKENSDVNSANNVANNQTTNSQNKEQNQISTASNTNKENEENSEVNSVNNTVKKQKEYIPELKNEISKTKNEDLTKISYEFADAKNTAIQELNKSNPTVFLQTTEQLKIEKLKVENDITKIETEIEQLKNSQKKERKKKKIEEIEKLINEKEQQLLVLNEQKNEKSTEIEKQKQDEITLKLNDKSIFIDEEKSQEVLSSNAYKEYVNAVISFEQEKEYYDSISSSLEKKQKELNELVNIQVLTKNKRNGEVEIETLIKEIEKNQTQQEIVYVKLKGLKKAVEKVEQENSMVAEEMKTLAANQKEPLTKIEVIKDEILATGGFEVSQKSSSLPRENSSVPMNVKTPSGLVYRVQIGAFRKPLQTNIYSQFTPVSGELQSNGLTVYMAGYFNNSTKAVNARKQIQSLGYSDAFIIAYCNGKKLTLGEARQLEERGECIPKGDNEFLVEISKNTREALSAQNTNPNINNSTASVIDTKSLFFTVQIGVYNKPINEKDKFPGLSEINSIVSPKKQIRYSTGKFSEINLAKARKNEAVQSGISDAFIVAYYQGERITITQANELLTKNKDLLTIQSEQTKSANGIDSVKFVENEKKYFTPLKDEVKIEKIKYEVNTFFEELPKEKMAYFNKYGLFQFDNETGKLFTTEFSKEADLADELKLSGLVSELKSTEEVNKIKLIKLDELNGDLIDLLLRTNWLNSIETSKEISLILNSRFSTNENYTNLLKNTFDLKIENYDKK